MAAAEIVHKSDRHLGLSDFISGSASGETGIGCTTMEEECTMAQTDFTAKQMGKQAVIFGAAALIATFLLSCLVGLLTAGGMLPESAMQVVSMGILCVCVFASSFLAAKAAPGKKLIASVLSAAGVRV